MSDPRPSRPTILGTTMTSAKAVSLSAFLKDDAPAYRKWIAEVGQFVFGIAIAAFVAWFGPAHGWTTLEVIGGLALGLIIAAPQMVRSSLSVIGSVIDLLAKARGQQPPANDPH